MNLLNFFGFYLLLLILAAFIIIGFYIITRGQKHIQPDGTYRTTGKIFKQWSLFWENTTGMQKVYFCEDQLLQKFRQLLEYNSPLAEKLKLTPEKRSLEIVGHFTLSDIVYLKETMNVDAEVNLPYLYLYNEEPVYRFPEWVRYPLSQCPPCMGSVGGSLLYWPVVGLAGDGLFTWSAAPAWTSIFFWILFCLALSAANKLALNIIGT